MTTWLVSQGRMLKSARALVAYFEHKLDTSLELLSEPPAEPGDGDVQFSLSVSHYGIWGLRSPHALAHEDQAEIYRTFQSVLGGISSMEQQRDDLERTHCKLEQSQEEMPSNVIPLRRVSGPLLSVPRPGQSDDRRWVLKQDCLIESKYISEIHKMAMELHVHSGRYAFVEYRDLDKAQRASIPELLSLGGISLFVPDFIHLTMDEQSVLKDLIAMDALQRPLLMVGTTLPFAELRSVPGVHLEFLTNLARAYIKLSKPFSEYKQQGLIHYFLDTLAESPT